MMDTAHSGKFVAYYRVSTQRQGASGLGLAAQKHAVESYLNGGRWKLVGEYTEVESGRSDSRVQLQKAIASCRVYGATLVVAKMDRLSRSTLFLVTLRDSKVRFLAVDNPTANDMTVTILAAVAENESKAIGERTHAAMQAAKRRGVRFGNPNHFTTAARKKGPRVSAERRAAEARRHASDLRVEIEDLRNNGARSLRELAAGLNAKAIPTASSWQRRKATTGTGWTAMGVKRLLDRIASKA
jgi:DNA invertase Pin-like site-specific DNA recombinase